MDHVVDLSDRGRTQAKELPFESYRGAMVMTLCPLQTKESDGQTRPKGGPAPGTSVVLPRGGGAQSQPMPHLFASSTGSPPTTSPRPPVLDHGDTCRPPDSPVRTNTPAISPPQGHGYMHTCQLTRRTSITKRTSAETNTMLRGVAGPGALTPFPMAFTTTLRCSAVWPAPATCFRPAPMAFCAGARTITGLLDAASGVAIILVPFAAWRDASCCCIWSCILSC